MCLLPMLDTCRGPISMTMIILKIGGKLTRQILFKTPLLLQWWFRLQIHIKGNFLLACAFVPHEKEGSTIVASSSGIAFLPPGLPFLARISAYFILKLGMARFYAHLTVEHPALKVFNLLSVIVETALYRKGKLNLEENLGTSKKACTATSCMWTWLFFSSTSYTFHGLAGKSRSRGLLWKFLAWQLDCRGIKSWVSSAIGRGSIIHGNFIRWISFERIKIVTTCSALLTQDLIQYPIQLAVNHRLINLILGIHV